MSASEDLDIKEESSELYMSETPPPIDVIPATTTSPLQPIMSATTTVIGNINLINVKLYLMQLNFFISYLFPLADFTLE